MHVFVAYFVVVVVVVIVLISDAVIQAMSMSTPTEDSLACSVVGRRWLHYPEIRDSTSEWTESDKQKKKNANAVKTLHRHRPP